MGLIKKHYQKIISYGLIIIGAICLLVLLILHTKLIYYWYPLFAIVVGLTLLPLSGGRHEK